MEATIDNYTEVRKLTEGYDNYTIVVPENSISRTTNFDLN